jgi:hypothetical protein
VRAGIVFRNGAEVKPEPKPVLVPWERSLDDLLNSATSEKLEDTHRKSITVTLKVADVHAGKRLTFDQVNFSWVELVIEPGEVWKVELAAGVSEAQAASDGRFYPEVLSSFPLVPDSTGKRYFAAAPFVFALEGATRDLPGPREVYRVFRPSVDAEGRISFSWRRKVSRKDAAVGTVEIGWQQWRFTGPPAAPFPYGAIGNLNAFPTGSDPKSLAFPINWEVEAFADRTDEPLRARRFQPKLPTAVRGRTVEAEIPLGYEVPSPSMPARYLRFQVKAESRYVPAYQKPIAPVTGMLESAPWSTPWKRLFRAARPDGVKPLTVRALVPLTRALRSPTGRPDNLSGVLLVIDGAVGETGGVAESIEARPLRITRELKTKAKSNRPRSLPPIHWCASTASSRNIPTALPSSGSPGRSATHSISRLKRRHSRRHHIFSGLRPSRKPIQAPVGWAGCATAAWWISPHGRHATAGSATSSRSSRRVEPCENTTQRSAKRGERR